MAHNTNIISSIKLPNGNTYEIHDAQAIHDVSDLGLAAAMVFKGTVATVGDLPKTNNKTGDVWHVTADDYEYVWTEAGVWEELGAAHDVATSDHTHNVTVTGTNKASAVTGTVTVPTVSKTTKYMKATVARGNVTTDNALGENATFTTVVTPSTTNIKATASGVAVGANGTAAAITGLDPTTDAAMGANATFKVSGGAATTSKMVTTTVQNPSVTAVSIPNVTGNTSVTASKVAKSDVTASKVSTASLLASATVIDGVLSFVEATVTDVGASKITSLSDVTATNTTLGTALSASKVTTSDVTVATGALASTGTGSAVATGVGAITVSVDNADSVDAITSLGTPTTANVLTGVKVTSQPTVSLATGATAGTGVVSVATGIASATTTTNSKDSVAAVTAVPVPTVTLSGESSSDTGRVAFDTVTIGSGAASHNLTASAQEWTQASGSTGSPQ
jgi:hypothetical protein